MFGEPDTAWEATHCARVLDCAYDPDDTEACQMAFGPVGLYLPR
jgi:hypothetical protein